MTQSVTIVVPEKPMSWSRAQPVMRGGKVHVHNDPEMQRRKAVIRAMAFSAMGKRPIFDGPVSIYIVHVMPIPESWSPRKRSAAIDGIIQPAHVPDIDNLDKLILDALNPYSRTKVAVVWNDDAQVVEKRSRKVYGLDPRTLIRVKTFASKTPLFVAPEPQPGAITYVEDLA